MSADAPGVTIEVTVPALLADCVGGRRRFPLQAATLAEALRRLLDEHPQLRPHLYDEAMHQRKHVLLFYNDDNLSTIEDRAVALTEGDRLLVLQAVSGG